jgi:hypothetical protein
MTRTSWFKAGSLAAVCATVGAVAGIAGGAASPSVGKAPQGAPHWRMHRGGPGGPPIHAEAVVPKRSGSGFETVTEGNGKLKSRSGNDITITEGTRTETYKDVIITVASDAKVFRNGNKATVDDLQDGDFVHVIQSPEGTRVMAADANFRPRFQGGRSGFRHGPPPGMPGPPPGP